MLEALKAEELEEEATCAKIAQVQKEGTRQVTRNISYYNLDMIYCQKKTNMVLYTC